MTVALWRIATKAPTYSADDMTGAGAKLSGGRWNSKGTAMLYTSENVAPYVKAGMIRHCLPRRCCRASAA
jgi:RES domain-containing protein